MKYSAGFTDHKVKHRTLNMRPQSRALVPASNRLEVNNHALHHEFLWMPPYLPSLLSSLRTAQAVERDTRGAREWQLRVSLAGRRPIRVAQDQAIHLPAIHLPLRAMDTMLEDLAMDLHLGLWEVRATCHPDQRSKGNPASPHPRACR